MGIMVLAGGAWVTGALLFTVGLARAGRGDGVADFAIDLPQQAVGV